MYDPGSVNKIITMSAALETGVVTPDSVLTVPYQQQFGAKLVTDSHHHATEQYTANGVFMQSSNVGTVQIAEKLGKQRLTDYMRAYGFGAKTGIGLPGESAGLVPDPARLVRLVAGHHPDRPGRVGDGDAGGLGRSRPSPTTACGSPRASSRPSPTTPA